MLLLLEAPIFRKILAWLTVPTALLCVIDTYPSQQIIRSLAQRSNQMNDLLGPSGGFVWPLEDGLLCHAEVFPSLAFAALVRAETALSRSLPHSVRAVGGLVPFLPNWPTLLWYIMSEGRKSE